MLGMRNILSTVKLFRFYNYMNVKTEYLVTTSYKINTSSIANKCIKVHPNGTISPVSQQLRCYAKGKDKKKEKGKSKIEINETQVSQIVNVDIMKNEMQECIDQLKDEFIKHISLRSSGGSIEMIPVNVDGKDHTLQELSQIIRKNPKTVVINMSVFPQAIPAALKAIAKSGMNLNPQQDGTTLYIPVPKVTKEHRENLSKNAKQLFVKCKDKIRDVQIKNTKKIKKKGDISEDLARNIENQVIAIADKFITQAEIILENKQKELLGKD